MSVRHRWLVMLLALCLSVQGLASTVSDLCRFACEQAVSSALTKPGSISQDDVSLTSVQATQADVPAVQRDEKAAREMGCSHCSTCEQCVHQGAALLSSVPIEYPWVALPLRAFDAEPVPMSDQERPFKPPKTPRFDPLG